MPIDGTAPSPHTLLLKIKPVVSTKYSASPQQEHEFLSHIRLLCLRPPNVWSGRIPS